MDTWIDSKSGYEHLSLDELRRGCEREEVLRNISQGNPAGGQQRESAHCLELFRRAVRDEDQEAWTAMFEQFEGQVNVWVQGHPLYTPDLEEPLFFTSLAFENTWQRLSPARLDRFPSFAAVRRYLQMAVHSALAQNQRGREKTNLLDEYTSPVSDREALSASAVPPIPVPSGQGVEPDAYVETQAEKLWKLLETKFQDGQERILVYARYVLALSPVGVLSLYPRLFAGSDELNGALDRLAARLGADEELRDFLDLNEVDASLEDQLSGILYRIFCPEAIELGELLLGVLPEQQVEPVQDHLVSCPLCAREQGWLQAFLEALEPPG